jgi:hypothetical protein
MSYQAFERKIRARFGGNVIDVCREEGKYIARLSGGIRVFGNSIAHSVTVKWGSGHSAIAAL